MKNNQFLQHPVMVVVPEIAGKGGVANFFRTVQLDAVPGVRYFSIYENKERLTNPVRKAVWLVGRLAKFWRELSTCSVVHINPSMVPKSYYRDIVFAWMTLFRGRRLVTLWHGWEVSLSERIRNSRFQSWLFRRTYGRSQGIIVLGLMFEEKVRDLGVGSGVFFRITPALDRTHLDGFNLEKRLSGSEPRSRMMFLARLEREKGAHIAIGALQRLRERYPERDYRLWIVGDGPEYQALRAMVADRGIEGAVFTGRISDAEKYELLKSVDIFIFPTCYGEGLPAVLLEAMLCGLPVISRPMGAIAEQVEHGVNGLLTESKTANRFAEYVLRLTDGREEYDAMARANFQKATREYASEVVRERLLGIYAAVLAV